MTFRIAARSSVSALSLLAAGWIAFASPSLALANGLDDSNQAAVDAMPHSAPVRNGTPQVTESGDGKPEISYTGPARGNLSPGVPHLSALTDNGAPVITYTPRAHRHAAAAAPVAATAATAPATPDAMATPAVPADLHMLLGQARQALQAHRMDQARDRLERAETALLNARVDGEHGDAGTLRDLASARAAVALNNQGAALRDLGQVMKTLDGAAG